MRRRIITTGLLLGGLVLAACGSAGPGVQARQTGDSTTTTTTTAAAETTTTTTGGPAPTTAGPAPTVPPATAAAQPPCTVDAVTAAYTAKYGSLGGASLAVQNCVQGWATSAQTKGFDPPVFALYQAEGDHWLALNRSAGKLCAGYGVPLDVARQIGCDT